MVRANEFDPREGAEDLKRDHGRGRREVVLPYLDDRRLEQLYHADSSLILESFTTCLQHSFPSACFWAAGTYTACELQSRC